MAWFGPDGRYAGRFGGGIVSLKLLYPLLDKFNESGLGLSFQLHTDKPPSFGYWMSQQATTLFEFWSNSEYTFDGGLNSFNHIMCKCSRSLCVFFRLEEAFAQTAGPVAGTTRLWLASSERREVAHGVT